MTPLTLTRLNSFSLFVFNVRVPWQKGSHSLGNSKIVNTRPRESWKKARTKKGESFQRFHGADSLKSIRLVMWRARRRMEKVFKKLSSSLSRWSRLIEMQVQMDASFDSEKFGDSTIGPEGEALDPSILIIINELIINITFLGQNRREKP